LYYLLFVSFSVCIVRPARLVSCTAPGVRPARCCLSLPCKPSKERAPNREGNIRLPI